MAQAKALHLDLPVGKANIQIWDRDFYAARVPNSLFPTPPSQALLSPYFSVGSCIAGLSSLFNALYDIHFEVQQMESGEMWLEGDVQKLAVIDEREGKIGEIYCDLFAREGKPPGAAHFTVRCSRRLDDDEAEGDFPFLAAAEDKVSSFPITSPVYSSALKSGKHQFPVVMLTCEFDRPDGQRPGLLTWQEVETLFHEMGHAMHCESFVLGHYSEGLTGLISHDRAYGLPQCRRYTLRH